MSDIAMNSAVHVVLLCAFLSGCTAARTGDVREVQFTTADSVRVYGDFHQAPGGSTNPVILLFHQGGGDARGEYRPIVPRLLREGYSVLAIDLRSGGTRFAGTNRTVAALSGRTFTYCEAYADVEAALRFVRRSGFTGRIVAWGSSYSATLVMRLGVEHSAELASVVAFSPAAGGPMGECQPEPYIAQIGVPLLVVRPESEMASETARRQAQLLAERHLDHYAVANGVHGSSILVASRVNGDVEPQWQRVLSFLRSTARQ